MSLFGLVTRVAAEECGIEKTPQEWSRLVMSWIKEYRERHPEFTKESDTQIFNRFVEETRSKTGQ